MVMPMFGRAPAPEVPPDDPIFQLRVLAAELKSVSKRLSEQVNSMPPKSPERPEGDRNDVRGK